MPMPSNLTHIAASQPLAKSLVDSYFSLPLASSSNAVTSKPSSPNVHSHSGGVYSGSVTSPYLSPRRRRSRSPYTPSHGGTQPNPKHPGLGLTRAESHRPLPATNKLHLFTLAGFVDCFHPTQGRLRVGSEKWYEPEEYMPVEHFDDPGQLLAGEVLADSIECLTIDLRYVVGDDEWGKNPDFGVPIKLARRLPLSLPKLYKMTFIGAEYVEENEERAKMVAEIIEYCGRYVLEVEWLTSTDHQNESAMPISTSLVHPLIIEAGNRTWGPDAIEAGMRDGGLRKFAIEGGFPIRNPIRLSTDSDDRQEEGSKTSWKTDYTFAFADWVPLNGVATLCWSFKGAYTQACVLTILKHVFKYLASTFVPPCSILILQNLAPNILRSLSAPDDRIWSKLGITPSSNPRLIQLLEDLVFVESMPVFTLSSDSSPSLALVPRLWSTEYEEPEDGDDQDRRRGIRRFKAEILANEHGTRTSVLNAVMAATNLMPQAFIPPAPYASRPQSRRSTQSSIFINPDLTIPEDEPKSFRQRGVETSGGYYSDDVEGSGLLYDRYGMEEQPTTMATFGGGESLPMESDDKPPSLSRSVSPPASHRTDSSSSLNTVRSAALSPGGGASDNEADSDGIIQVLSRRRESKSQSQKDSHVQRIEEEIRREA